MPDGNQGGQPEEPPPINQGPEERHPISQSEWDDVIASTIADDNQDPESVLASSMAIEANERKRVKYCADIMREYRVERDSPMPFDTSYNGGVENADWVAEETDLVRSTHTRYFRFDERGVACELGPGDIKEDVVAVSEIDAKREGLSAYVGGRDLEANVKRLMVPNTDFIDTGEPEMPTELQPTAKDNDEDSRLKWQKFLKLRKDYQKQSDLHNAYVEVQEKQRQANILRVNALVAQYKSKHGTPPPGRWFAPIVATTEGMAMSIYDNFNIYVSPEDVKQYIRDRDNHTYWKGVSEYVSIAQQMLLALDSTIAKMDNGHIEVDLYGLEWLKNRRKVLSKQIVDLKIRVDKWERGKREEKGGKKAVREFRFNTKLLEEEDRADEQARAIIETLGQELDQFAAQLHTFKPDKVPQNQRGRVSIVADKINTFVDEFPDRDIKEDELLNLQTKYNTLLQQYIDEEKQNAFDLETENKMQIDAVASRKELLETIDRLHKDISNCDNQLEALYDEGLCLSKSQRLVQLQNYNGPGNKEIIIEISRLETEVKECEEKRRLHFDVSKRSIELKKSLKLRIWNLMNIESIIVHSYNASRAAKAKIKRGEDIQTSQKKQKSANETRLEKKSRNRAFHEVRKHVNFNEVDKRKSIAANFETLRLERINKMEQAVLRLEKLYEDERQSLKEQNEERKNHISGVEGVVRNVKNRLRAVRVALNELRDLLTDLSGLTGPRDLVSNLDKKLHNLLQTTVREINDYQSLITKEEATKQIVEASRSYSAIRKSIEDEYLKLNTNKEVAEHKAWLKKWKEYNDARKKVQQEDTSDNRQVMKEAYLKAAGKDLKDSGDVESERREPPGQYVQYVGVKGQLKEAIENDEAYEFYKELVKKESKDFVSMSIYQAFREYKGALDKLKDAPNTDTQNQAEPQLKELKGEYQAAVTYFQNKIAELSRVDRDIEKGKRNTQSDIFKEIFDTLPSVPYVSDGAIAAERRNVRTYAIECAKVGVMNANDIERISDLIYKTNQGHVDNFKLEIDRELRNFKVIDPLQDGVDQTDFYTTMSYYFPVQIQQPKATPVNTYNPEAEQSVTSTLLNLALKDIITLANEGSGRAVAYRAVVCKLLDRQEQTELPVLDANGQDNGMTRTVDCRDFTMWKDLQVHHRSVYNDVTHALRMWNKLPCQLRGGSWPTPEEIAEAVRSEACPNGEKPFLDRVTGELMVYTTDDVTRNKTGLGDATPVAWVSIKRDDLRESVNVPITDQGKVVRQGDVENGNGFRLWQTAREFFERCMKREDNVDQSAAEVRALEKCVRAPKYPRLGGDALTDYDDVQPADFTPAMYIAANENKRRLHVNENMIQALAESIRIARIKMEELKTDAEAMPVTSSSRMFKIDQSIGEDLSVERRMLLMTAVGNPSATAEQASRYFALDRQVSRYRDAMRKYRVRAQYNRGMPQPWSSLSSGTSEDAYTLASSMSSPHQYVTVKVHHIGNFDEKLVGDEKDGLENTDWMRDESQSALVVSAFTRFVKSYYSHISNELSVEEGLEWMKKLKLNGYPYVMVHSSTTNVRTSTCFPIHGVTNTCLGPSFDNSMPERGSYPAWLQYSQSWTLPSQIVNNMEMSNSASKIKRVVKNAFRNAERHAADHSEEMRWRIQTNEERRKAKAIAIGDDPRSRVSQAYEKMVSEPEAKDVDDAMKILATAMDDVQSMRLDDLRPERPTAAEQRRIRQSDDLKRLNRIVRMNSKRQLVDQAMVCVQESTGGSAFQLDDIWIDYSGDGKAVGFEGSIKNAPARDIPLIMDFLTDRYPGNFVAFLKVVQGESVGVISKAGSQADQKVVEDTLSVLSKGVRPTDKFMSFVDLHIKEEDDDGGIISDDEDESDEDESDEDESDEEGADDYGPIQPLSYTPPQILRENEVKKVDVARDGDCFYQCVNLYMRIDVLSLRGQVGEFFNELADNGGNPIGNPRGITKLIVKDILTGLVPIRSNDTSDADVLDNIDDDIMRQLVIDPLSLPDEPLSIFSGSSGDNLERAATRFLRSPTPETRNAYVFIMRQYALEVPKPNISWASSLVCTVYSNPANLCKTVNTARNNPRASFLHTRSCTDSAFCR